MLSKSSLEKLETCDERLQELFKKVSETYPIQIVCGFRDKAGQDEAFEKGFSKVQFPNSKHNSFPSLAVDAVPIFDGKINWKDQIQLCHMAGYVQGIAKILGIKIRWGGDFNRNIKIGDQSFMDGYHFEIDE